MLLYLSVDSVCRLKLDTICRYQTVELAPVSGLGPSDASAAFVGLVDFGVFCGESGNGKVKSDPSEVSELCSAFS